MIPTAKKRIVIKLGTSVLTGGTPRLDRPAMVDIVRQCAALYAAGHDVVVCSSGAVAAGRERLGHPALPRTVTSKQLFAAVGQSRLMLTWESFFEIYGIHVGQILLTRADYEARNRFLNARETMQALLEHRLIPIVNENDAVGTEELRVGDNDNLSALVAVLAEADLLLILTDQAGLYTADPRTNPDARLISEVTTIDADLRQLAGGSGTVLGTGGMATKLQAADIARRAGTDVIIAAGAEPNVITRIVLDDEALGTRFPALENPLKSRKRWLLVGTHPAGSVTINKRAVRVLRGEGVSLLPAGIVAVNGSFGRGEIISIVDERGRELGRGLTRYTGDELRQIAGHHSDEIEAILGYAYGPVAIHRNDLVLLVDSVPD